MNRKTGIVALDYTGTLTGIDKTSMNVLLEVAFRRKNQGEQAVEAYQKLLTAYGTTAGTRGSDAALIEFYLENGALGVTRQDIGRTVENCFREGIIRPEMLEVLVKAAGDSEIYLVSKNSQAELEDVAVGINEYSRSRGGPSQVIAGVIGVDLIFDPATGRIAGVKESITDGTAAEANGVNLHNKADLVRQVTSGNRFHYVSDEKDFDIARLAQERGGNAVLIRYLPGTPRDFYFDQSPDYQLATLQSGAYNKVVPHDRVREELPALLL